MRREFVFFPGIKMTIDLTLRDSKGLRMDLTGKSLSLRFEKEEELADELTTGNSRIEANEKGEVTLKWDTNQSAALASKLPLVGLLKVKDGDDEVIAGVEVQLNG